MEFRKFGIQIYIDRLKGLSEAYKMGFKVFELIMDEITPAEMKEYGRQLTREKGLISRAFDEDEEVEIHLRAPSLSFTGVGNHNHISDILDFCNHHGIGTLVLKPGEAISSKEDHIREAMQEVIAFMNAYGHKCEEYGITILWENGGNFGTIENIIEFLSNKILRYREYFKARFNLEHYEEGKHTLQEACDEATELLFTNYHGDHFAVLERTNGMTVIVPEFLDALGWKDGKAVIQPRSFSGYQFKCKLIWEESPTY